MAEFIQYWLHNIRIGWQVGDGILGIFVEFCLVVSAGLFLFKKFRRRHWQQWEEIIMRKAFHSFWISFAITTFFIAPFLQDRDQSKKTTEQAHSVTALSNQVVELTAELGRKNDLAQNQFATILSYQGENAKLSRQLSEIEYQRDPTAKGIKNRCLILSHQILDFFFEYQTNEANITETIITDDRREDSKMTWPPPTNQVELAKWKEQRDKNWQEFQKRETQEYMESNALWVKKFLQEFSGRILDAREQLAKLGYESKRLNNVIESPINNTWVIQIVGVELQGMAEKIPD